MKKTILIIVLATLCLIFKVMAQTNRSASTIISGQIIDNNKKAIGGVTVLVETSNNGCVTDNQGHFLVSTALKSGKIKISFLGFETVELNFDNSSKPFLVHLVTTVNSLNAIQVIGYGTTTKRLNTGSVSSISAKEIEEQPVSNPIAALQGRASGVSIQTQNGLPGGGISVQIRGQGSIASGTDPLYIVDGVPFLSASISTAITPANGNINPLSILNPGDIERIDILKDADATAIYGSRAANGVILITTKKGKSGRTNFDIDVNQGYSEIGKYAQLMNLPQYLEMRAEAFKNDGITPDASSAPDLLVWSQTHSINWQKYEFGHKAAMTNIQTNLTGGDGSTQFLFSTNYRDEGTIFPGNENYKKGGGYLNLSHSSIDKKFTGTLSVSYELDDNHTLYNASTALALLPPNYPVYNSDGTYNWEAGLNPVAQLGQVSRIQSNNLIVNGTFQYEIIKGLNIKTSLGYTRYAIDQLATLPQDSQNNLYETPLATAYQSDNTSSSYIIEPQLNYSLSTANGKLSALIGATIQNTISQGDNLTETGINNPALLGNISAASTITGFNTYTDYKYASLFSRLNYEWLQQYILDLNFRRDGSSRFGDNRQFGNFGAAGAAWIFSEEGFIRDRLPFLSFGKLRGSYGVTGNDQIADYKYLTAYGSSSNYGGTSSLAPSRIANPDYGWETTHQLETALELGFLQSRIMLKTAWYKRRSDNQLVPFPLPYQSGFSSYEANLPATVQNTGWEIDLNTINIKSKDVSWTSTFNLTIPKNILMSYPGLAGSAYANSLVVGQDLTVYKGYRFTGINAQTGVASFEDVNHDGTISYPQDVEVLGKTSPLLYGGFGNSVSVHGLELDVFFEFRKQYAPEYAPGYGSATENEPTSILNRWQSPGNVTNIPKFTTDYSNIALLSGSSAQFGDDSYIRLKNISISYNLSPELLKKLDIKALKFFIEGENILTFTDKNRISDPEILASSGSVPPLKTFVAGLKITL
jgi:TonB-linked SusC/RagA family outer membrane protein